MSFPRLRRQGGAFDLVLFEVLHELLDGVLFGFGEEGPGRLGLYSMMLTRVGGYLPVKTFNQLVGILPACR